MPQLIYRAMVIGNKEVYNGRNAPVFGMTQSGTPMPTDTPVQIDSATLTFTMRDIWAHRMIGHFKGQTPFDEGFSQQGGVRSIDQRNPDCFRSIGELVMEGDGGSAGTLKSGSEIIITVNWSAAVTPTSPPTSVTVTPAIAETTARLAWSGAQGGIANGITSYRIQRRDSQNGADWSAWVDEGTVTGTSKTVDAPPTRGHLRMFRVRAIGSAGEPWAGGWKESPALRRNRLPADPANVSASPALHESGAVTLSWGASADPDGNLDHYEVEKQENGGPWEALGSTGTAGCTHTPTAPRGTLLRYRVRAVDALGAASAWVLTNEVRRNRLPSAPGNLTASPLLHQSGGVLFGWEASSDPDGNLQGYHLESRVSTNGSSWGMWTDAGNTAGTSIRLTPVLAPGGRTQLRIRAVDTLGAKSEPVLFPEIRQNTPPPEPTVRVPAEDAALNSMEVLCFAEAGADPDHHAQTLQVRVDQGSWQTLPGGKARIHVPGGSHTLLFRAVDALDGTSGSVSRAVTVTPAAWSREIHPGTVIANALISHCTDITELLAAVNRVRRAYGLDAIQLPGSIGRWADWKAQMLALQAGLTACTALAGETISWATVDGYPSAAVINGIRRAVEQL